SYPSSSIGFDGHSCGVQVSIGQQSPDIASGVDTSWESRAGERRDPFDDQGAGDQGFMVGYASDDTPQLMPLPIWLAHRLAERLAFVRKEGIVAGLRPDGKTQVTIAYDEDRPVALDSLVVSAQHDADVTSAWLRSAIAAEVVAPVLAEHAPQLDTAGHNLYVNPTGQFVVGGPWGDAGLTWRRIIVDTYGGMARRRGGAFSGKDPSTGARPPSYATRWLAKNVAAACLARRRIIVDTSGGMARQGGGAFSGKDPSKVDRSASYATRWVAKNVVAAGLARRCEVHVAYAIGMAHPVGVYVETFGTETVPVE